MQAYIEVFGHKLTRRIEKLPFYLNGKFYDYEHGQPIPQDYAGKCTVGTSIFKTGLCDGERFWNCIKP